MATCFQLLILISSCVVIGLDHKFFMLVHIICCKLSQKYCNRSMLTKFSCCYTQFLCTWSSQALSLLLNIMFFPLILTVKKALAPICILA